MDADRATANTEQEICAGDKYNHVEKEGCISIDKALTNTQTNQDPILKTHRHTDNHT